jgi:hypothetical protein
MIFGLTRSGYTLDSAAAERQTLPRLAAIAPRLHTKSRKIIGIRPGATAQARERLYYGTANRLFLLASGDPLSRRRH